MLNLTIVACAYHVLLMFYRTERGVDPVSLICDAAGVSAALPPNLDLLDDFVSTCTPSVAFKPDAAPEASYSVIDEADLDISKDLIHQHGVIGLLEYILTSGGAHRERLIPLCLSLIDPVTSVYPESATYYEEYIQLENFLYEANFRLIKIAEKYEDGRPLILDHVWRWCRKYAEALVGEGEPANKSRSYLVAMLASFLGVLGALTDSRANLHTDYVEHITFLVESIFEEKCVATVFRAAHAADSASSKIPTFAEQGFDNIRVATDVFVFLKTLLLDWANLGHAHLQGDQWSLLVDNASQNSSENVSDKLSSQHVQDCLAAIFELCWDERWKRVLKETCSETDQEAFHSLMSIAVQTAVLCTLNSPSLYSKCLANLEAALDDPASFLDEHMKAETFIVCVEGLGVLALRNNTYLPEANEFLCHLLTGPSSVFSNMNDEASLSALRHCAAIILRKCLTAANSSSTTKSSLFALINAAQGVYADVNESEPFSREYIVYVNSIVALAGISPALKPKEVIEVAIPLLTRRLRDGPDVHFESLMWECLGNVGLTCDESVYTEVVSFMLEHSKRTFSKIAKISHTLARMDGRSSTFHRIYLEYILTMFMEKASTLHTATSAQALQTIGELKELSNILRIICDQWDFSPNATAAPAGSIDHKEPDTEIAVLFRNFWLYMVLYVLQPNGRWPSSEKDSYGGWAAIALSIAAKTPPLVLLSQSTNLEVELSANSILRGKLSEATITRARSALSNILPASAATELRNLSFLESAYLLAVFQIETLRIRRSWDVSYIFKYLTEERFYGTNVYSVFELLADEVCKIFVRDNIGPEGSQALKNSTNPEPGTTDIIRSIEAHARELILRAAHRRERVRKAAKRAVVNVLEYFPATLWNSRLLTLMLDILQVLDALACGASGKKEAGLVARSQIDLSFVNAQDASGAAHDFFELCVMWLQTANKRCASETTGLLQRYLIVLHIEFPNLSPTEKSDLTSLMSRFYAHPEAKAAVMQSLEKTALYMGEVQGMLHSLMWMQGWSLSECNQRLAELMKGELEKIIKGGESAHHNHHHGHSDEVLSTELSQRLNSWLHRAVALIISADKEFDEDLLRSVCWTPIALFSAEAMEVGIGAWSWIMNARPDLATGILGTLLTQWEHTAVQRFGLYGKEKRPLNAFMQKMTYAPAVPPTNAEDATKAHQLWIRFLSDRFRVCRHTGRESTKIFTKLVQIICSFSANARTNPIVRETRWMSLNLGLKVVADLDKKNDPAAPYIRFAVYSDAFDWFSAAPRWGAPSTAEVASLVEFYTLLKASRPERSQKLLGQWTCKPGKAAFASHIIGGRVELDDAHQILLLFLENEINRLGTWHDPLDEKDGELSVPQISERTVKWTSTVQSCWAISPALALQLRARVVGPGAEQIEKDLAEIFKTNALSLISLEHAHPPGAKPAHHTLGQSLDGEGLSLLAKLSATAPTNMALRALLYWAPLPPISAVALLGPGSQKAHPWVLQFATKVLEFFPVDQVFFYIPQMVQALRYDVGGYMEHFILETAKLSQLFAHQIIWNMRANIDPEGKPDPARTVFERIIEEIVHALSGSDKEFYEREFKFFEEVTSISGKLKPYIPKSKQEKKKKIDEELRLIKVDVGVYLPSNPESIVVDIDYDSGRPLQSHAKAPFMATFKIRRADEDDTTDSSGTETDQNTTPLWQSAIFKVGDDCRQDVLALQLISIFKNIFSVVGLDLYVFPYRVVATAAGCGIIEVIPKSISRDMMGREKVNDLFGYFRAKFGPTDSMKFQKARLAFVKSLAPYSLILYLLQIKDRHNGNIMFDEDGHILHIDFGFILDIAPGGIKFEASPFKLTTEMVEVMGGDATTPAYHLFSEKVVQAYLAVRPYADEIIHMVSLMIDSGLPCFKEATLRNLRDRFQLQLSERAAADFMMARIKESHENTFSVMYDGFQKLQNGIPY